MAGRLQRFQPLMVFAAIIVLGANSLRGLLAVESKRLGGSGHPLLPLELGVVVMVAVAAVFTVYLYRGSSAG